MLYYQNSCGEIVTGRVHKIKTWSTTLMDDHGVMNMHVLSYLATHSLFQIRSKQNDRKKASYIYLYSERVFKCCHKNI